MSEITWSSWNGLTGLSGATQMCVGSNQDGRLQVFAVNQSGAVFSNWQVPPANGWSGWASFSNGAPVTFSELAVEQNSDGRMELFAIGSDGALWHKWQNKPDGDWSAWGSLTSPPGVTLQQPAVSRRRDGLLATFAIGSDGQLWTTSQSMAVTWSQWTALAPQPGKVAEQVAVTRTRAELLELFTLYQDKSYYRVAQGTDFSFSNWTLFGSFDGPAFNDPVAVLNEGGWLELFLRSPEGELWHQYQRQDSSGNISWTYISSLGNPAPGGIGNFTFGQNQDGRIQIFAIGPDGDMWRIAQDPTSSNGWGAWASLGAPASVKITQIAVGQTQDGRLEVFVIDTDGIISRISEQQSLNRVQWFQDLVARFAPVVYLNPLETYKPAPFDWYLTQTNLVIGDQNYGPMTPENISWPAYGEHGHLTYTWGNMKVEDGNLPAAVCYAHVTSAADWSGGYDIQYWFFYGFNGPITLGMKLQALGNEVDLAPQVPPLGDHQGDWEYIVVRVDGNGKLRQVYCSQHSGGTWYNAASPPGAKNGYTLTANGHPIIYSAWNGHPSYPWAADFPTEDKGTPIGFDVEEGFMGISLSASGGLLNQTAKGPEWDCSQPGKHQLIAISLPGITYPEPWWLQYRGRCGGVNPDRADMVQEAAKHLAESIEVELKSWDILLWPLAEAVALAVVTSVIAFGPFFGLDLEGPEALKLKDPWFTGE